MAENSHRTLPIRGLTIGVIFFCLFAMIGIPMLISSSSVSGEEFCPQLFQKREFSFRRLPGTKIRIWSTTLSPASSPCSKNVLTYLSTGLQTDWHVSTVQLGGTFQELGPKILINYLQSKNANGANVWDDWSFRNPTLAAILWPIVQEVAVNDLYFCVPDLLRSADNHLDAQNLRRTLLIVCTQAAQAKLKSLAETNETKLENELRSWALALSADFGTDPYLQQLRSQLSKP